MQLFYIFHACKLIRLWGRKPPKFNRLLHISGTLSGKNMLFLCTPLKLHVDNSSHAAQTWKCLLYKMHSITYHFTLILYFQKHGKKSCQCHLAFFPNQHNMEQWQCVVTKGHTLISVLGLLMHVEVPHLQFWPQAVTQRVSKINFSDPAALSQGHTERVHCPPNQKVRRKTPELMYPEWC